MQSGDTTSTVDPLGLGGTILATISALLILVTYTSLLLGWWKPIETIEVTERASDPFGECGELPTSFDLHSRLYCTPADFEPFGTRRPVHSARSSYASLPLRSTRQAASPLRANLEVPSSRLPELPPLRASAPHSSNSVGGSSPIPNEASPSDLVIDDPRDDVSTVMSLSSTVPPSYRSSRPTYPKRSQVPPMPVAGPVVVGSTSGAPLPISYPPSSFNQGQGGRPVHSRSRSHARPRGGRARKSQDGGVRLAGGPLRMADSGEIDENPFEDSRSLARTPSTRPPSYCSLEVSHAPAPVLPPL